jgi:SnoaL-like domain
MKHPPEHPHVSILRAVYADLTSIAEYCDDAVVLHPADRTLADVIGKAYVRAHESELIRLTAHSLLMDVEAIIANDFFGAVLGKLRAEKARGSIAMPFCGLWRFREGRIVEHWENAYDASEFGRFLAAS